LRNGLIADGCGSELVPGSVGIRDGKIAAVGAVDGPAERVIDVAGQVIAPGFIDIHSHSDYALFVEPSAQSKITQGVTTEVCGNCGDSAAPSLGEACREELAKWREEHDVQEDWTTLSEFLSALERRRIGVNFATYVGHSRVRSAVVGLRNREPRPQELATMRRLVAEAMREGAFGLSTGLIYPPSCFADTEEIVALAAEAAAAGGIYATHMRSERDELVEAVREAIEIGARSGAPVQISHHKACGKNNWGKVRDTLGMIDEARAAGQDVTADQYPYVASATSLSILLPDWVHDGGHAKTLERLRSPRERAKVEAYLERIARDGSIANDGGWQSVLISAVKTPENKAVEGKHILQLAQMKGKPPVTALVDLLIEEELGVGMVHFTQCEEDVRTVMAHPATMIGSDASARAVSGPTSNGKPHPRAYGTFPRVLGRYVREQRVIGLPEAIAKMTWLSARKLGLADRGRIAEGCWADIVVFDPDTVIDTATYAEPHAISRGISYVLVNGQVAAEHGELTGALAGMVLRKASQR